MTSSANNKVAIANNDKFAIGNILLMLLMGVFVACSLADKAYNIINWPDGYEELIGGSSQILTAIISLVVSIIGIAISLQNEDVFGIKLTKLYALRVEKYYSFLHMIMVSVLFCAVNMGFYLTGLTLAALGTVITALLFLAKVIRLEIPIMAKQEEVLIDILKNNLINCYLSSIELPKDLKSALKYLLCNKTLKETYDVLKEMDDKEYNEYLLLTLLDLQQHLAFEMSDKYSAHEQRIIASSLLTNVLDVLHNNLEVSGGAYSLVAKNKHLLTRVLFCVYKLESAKQDMLDRFCGLYQSLAFSIEEKKQQELLIASVIIILVTNTIRDNDLSLIKALRKQLSAAGWGLREPTTALSVFAVLSMYLYYLCCSEPDVEKRLKEEIKTFVDEGNYIEERTKILSWKQLFAIAAEKFAVDYDEFIALSINGCDLEYYLLGYGAKTVVITPSYLSHWYLAQLFNASEVYTFDFPALAEKYPQIQNYLKDFGESCLDKDQKFVITDRVKEIVSFYGNDENCFLYFMINEEYSHAFSQYINSIKYEELQETTEKARSIDNLRLAEKIKSSIKSAVEKELGFDSSLSMGTKERYLSVIWEKFPEAINFEKSIIDFCVQSILDDIKKSIDKEIIYKDADFESGIEKLLLKNIKYISVGAKNTHAYWIINNQALQQKLDRFCNDLEVFDGSILGSMVFVANKGIRFNCNVETVELRELSEEELAKQTMKYQRADGQFVFDGVFIPKEEIVEIIRDRFAVLSIVVQHRVVSLKSDVIEVRPYSKKQK